MCAAGGLYGGRAEQKHFNIFIGACLFYIRLVPPSCPHLPPSTHSSSLPFVHTNTHQGVKFIWPGEIWQCCITFIIFIIFWFSFFLFLVYLKLSFFLSLFLIPIGITSLSLSLSLSLQWLVCGKEHFCIKRLCQQPDRAASLLPGPGDHCFQLLVNTTKNTHTHTQPETNKTIKY